MYSMRFLMFVGVFLFLSCSLFSQEVLIDEDFTEDPLGSWTVNGNGYWDEPNGRIVVTEAVNNNASSVFYNEVVTVNNFRLEAQVKICCGSGADGMAITFIEGDESMLGSIGTGGGGMCVAGLTTGPQIVVEFDIYGNDATCEVCPADTSTGAAGNHIGVEYSLSGFDACIPGTAHEHNAACAGTGDIGFDLYGDYYFDIVVQVQNSMITVDIGCDALEVPMHRVIDHEFQDYDSFDGLVGITGATGGANAEQSVSYLKLVSLPEGTCLESPGEIVRSFPDVEDMMGIPLYTENEAVTVNLEIESLRGSDNCAPLAGVTVRETPPAGWTIENISSGGTFSGGVIEWEATGAALAAGTVFSYDGVPPSEDGTAKFAGNYFETAAGEDNAFNVTGDNSLTPASSFSGDVLILDDFIEDPAQTGLWTLNGPAYYDALEERIVVTTAVASQASSIFYNQVLPINNFRLEAQVKLCCGNGADGMAITFIEGTEADRFSIGNGGGGMCVTNLTTGPQIVVEFDIWGNGAACEVCPIDNANTGAAGNHIGVEYSSTGFDGGAGTTDCIPGTPHQDNAACAGTNAIGFDLYGDYFFELVVQVQNSVITVDIGSEDLGIDMHRVITHTFNDYESFAGLVGVTGSTGGSYAEQSISYIKLEALPEGTCLEAPCEVVRSFPEADMELVEGLERPGYSYETPLAVQLQVRNLREDSGNGCSEPTEIIVQDEVPLDWSAESISDGGSYADGIVEWTVSDADLVEGKALTYTAVPGTRDIEVAFAGRILEPAISEEDSFPVSGTSSVVPAGGEDVDPVEGGIRKWLILGPFMHDGLWENNEAIAREDYLADGADITEIDVIPEEGEIVDTDFMVAYSTGLALPVNPDSEINPEGIPQWYRWGDLDYQVDLQNDMLFGALDNVMCYAACYFVLEEPMTITIGSGSDDGIQVLVDGQEVTNQPLARGWPGFVDLSTPIELDAGIHLLMAKVFEIGGAWNFGCRLQDETGQPLFDGYTITLTPDSGPTEPLFMRGDANADGGVNIADAVFILAYYFSGGLDPVCADSADSNDDGGVNIADAVSVLSYYFSGGTIPDPAGSCGPDITPDDGLDCVSYPPCEGQ